MSIAALPSRCCTRGAASRGRGESADRLSIRIVSPTPARRCVSPEESRDP
jgi:hypothetical protein